MVYQVLKTGKYKDFKSLFNAREYAKKLGAGSMIWDAKKGVKIAKIKRTMR